ncbi:hypothetical protein AB833_12460 [Chromatiales bacterium (ex Bugula neritina AB1)]|nr:hypothetical protein AB833_12460 [Chromatiales bacterium (ex Bugula neritina AB1)]
MTGSPPAKIASLFVRRLALCGYILAFFCSQSLAQNLIVKPEAEVVHWWSKGSDAAAVQIIINEFTRRGGSWFNATETDYQAARQSAVSRIAKGYPPTVLQWKAGAEAKQFAELGLLNTITDPVNLQEFRSLYSDAVIESVSHGDQIVALPVNIHGENWLWYNADLVSSEDLATSTDWRAFVELLDSFETTGVPALAVGNNASQHRVIFNDIFLGVAGADQFNRFYHQLDKKVLAIPEFITVIETMRKLIPHSRSFGRGDWEDQVDAVARGDAAAVLTGDWAKGHFFRSGKKLGSNFGCTFAPGTQSNYLMVLDVFMLGNVSTASELAGQELLLDVLQDRETSIKFNQIKGSLPPFREIDATVMDHCSLAAKQLLEKDGAVIAPFASFGDGGFQSQIESVSSGIFTGKYLTIEETIAAFAEVLKGERLRRNGTMITINTDE